MIEVKNISKKFNNNVVLNGIDLNINKGDVVAIIGPSGTGKSTFLRCLNRLENTSCSFCLFLHIFLPSLCSPFLYFSFPICLICFVLYSYISYLSTMFCGFYLFLFLYNFNVVNYFLL